MSKLAIWWTLEAYAVLIAASIPTLRPLLGSSRSTGRVGSDRPSGYSGHSIACKLHKFSHPRSGQTTHVSDEGSFVQLHSKGIDVEGGKCSGEIASNVDREVDSYTPPDENVQPEGIRKQTTITVV
ncbi:MAG: hypothetical protein Q9165_008000 [Trypethelium subeluteriae]